MMNEMLMNYYIALVRLIFSAAAPQRYRESENFLAKPCRHSIFQNADIYKWWRKPTMLTPHTSIVLLRHNRVLHHYFSGSKHVANFGVKQILVTFCFRYLWHRSLLYVVSSMDAATAFGGMGGSREVWLNFVEPVIMLGILSNTLHTGSTSLSGMTLNPDELNLTVAGVLTGIAFFLVMLAENGRIPVDNPDTHLELTMVHECMTLEYSGRLLSLIHWASQLKLLVFLLLFSLLYFPLNFLWH